jgi:hypothetical protein
LRIRRGTLMVTAKQRKIGRKVQSGYQPFALCSETEIAYALEAVG